MSSAGTKWRLAHNSVWIIVFCILLSLAEQGCRKESSFPASQAKEQKHPPIPVLACKAVRQDVPIEIQAVGTVQASSVITVKSQVSGEITHISFKEGDFVKKGEELFRIDSRAYEAQLNQAEANLAKDEASLAQIQANLARDLAQQKYAQAEASRYSRLLDKQLVSKEQSEQSIASAEATSATVQADQAAIQSSRAGIEATKAAIANARVMLSYTIIRSPLDGRTGDLVIKQGNVISPNLELLTINQMNPVYVSFSVPQTQLSLIKKAQAVMVTKQDGSSASESGKVFFVDNAVDPATGSILLKAVFSNKNNALWPGQFVRAVLRVGIQKNALIIPNQAVQSGQEGPFVFVVKPDQRVESRPVVPGMRINENVVIEKGLQPNETVVTEGQLRLAKDSLVKVRDDSSK
jgi:multidrug efflux system membrane fusion protein